MKYIILPGRKAQHTFSKLLNFARLILIWFSAACQLQVAQAVQTNISSTEGAGNLNTHVTSDGSTFEVRGGDPRGGNLFHSFMNFSIGTGDTAKFLNDTGSSFSNIISRVTGGNISEIDGTLDTTAFDSANFFLINPAGMIFGPNASLNISGSFHATTADFIRMGDESTFNAVPSPEDAMLTAASPAEFGFLDDGNQNITLTGSTLEVPKGESLSLVGGNISLADSKLTAGSGQITIASIASSGILPINSISGVNRFERLGNIELSASIVKVQDVSGPGSKGIFIVGNVFTLKKGSMLDTQSLFGSAGPIRINATESVSIIDAGSAILSNAVFSSSAPGDISITTPRLEIQAGSISASSINSGGGGGTIKIEVDKLELRGSANLAAISATSGATNGDSAASISISAKDSVSISGGSILQVTATGNAGRISIDTPRLDLEESGIFASTFGDGVAGEIHLDVGKLTVSKNSGVRSTTQGTGKGGSITVTAETLLVNDGAEITTGTEGVGPGGDISISASNITLSNGGQISAENLEETSTGESGSIKVHADDTLRLINGGSISVKTAIANAGSIDLKVGNLLHLKDRSSITTSVADGKGDGGNITIDPIFVILEGGSEIIARAQEGSGGDIRIVTKFFIASPDSSVDASSGLGIDGAVNIESPDADVIPETLLLPESLLSVDTLMTSPCTTQAAYASSFVVSNSHGVPPGPHTLLPSSGLHLQERYLNLNNGFNQTTFSASKSSGQTENSASNCEARDHKESHLKSYHPRRAGA